MNKISTWLAAFRLRTLPLAFSCILMGSFIHGKDMRVEILVLALLTTLFLQVLSNLANDYGDYASGVDNEDRVGPKRTMQSGAITKKQMQRALIICSVLSLLSGVFLIHKSFNQINYTFFIFLGLGIAAIAAAIKYTMGKNPYGYKGFGDVFVFVFFGLVGVLGTSYLHQNSFNANHIWLSCSIGFLSAGVLNLNNLRDVVNDKKSGKNTLVVLLGYEKGKIYHIALLLAAIICPIIYNVRMHFGWEHYVFLIITPLWIKQMAFVSKCSSPEKLNPELKKLAISTLFFTLLYGLPFFI